MYKDYTTIANPHLIQRGSFKDIPDEEIIGLDSLIRYDYMGSSEFEWGALPTSLKRITSEWQDYIAFQIDSIKDADGQYLQVLCHKDKAKEIIDAISKLFSENCEFRLQERSGMMDYLKCESTRSIEINFWWDVTGSDHHYAGGSENAWMCCFGDNIRRLIIALRKVWVKHRIKSLEGNKTLEAVKEPDFGPEVPKPITRPKPSKIEIERERDILRVLTSGGRKTAINKRGLISFESTPERLTITVKNKVGALRALIIEEAYGTPRQVLENLLTENIDYNKRLAPKA